MVFLAITGFVFGGIITVAAAPEAVVRETVAKENITRIEYIYSDQSLNLNMTSGLIQ